MLYKPRNLIFASALPAAKKKNDLEYPVHIFIKQKQFFDRVGTLTLMLLP